LTAQMNDSEPPSTDDILTRTPLRVHGIARASRLHFLLCVCEHSIHTKQA